MQIRVIMAGRVKDGEYSSEDSADEYLCEYEKKRLENIKKNHELLRSLGKLSRPFGF